MNVTGDATERIATWQRWSVVAGAAGVLLAIVGFLLDRTGFLRSYLFGYLYWIGMTLGCLGILLMHHTVGGKWGGVIRRLCEAGARTLPFMAVMLLPVIFSISTLYIWARPDPGNASLRQKAYLNIPFFLVRTAFYFAVWILYSRLLSRWSAEQDRTGNPRLIARMRALSAPGLVVFTFTATFAFVDWIMSLEPHWFSTIYGAMFLIGQMLEAFALVIALVVLLSKAPPLSERVTPQHLHDLGNLMLTFTVLWAYLSFSQYLIIWAGNLPDEIPWYLRRLSQGWSAIAVFLIVFHFCVPFLLLLQRDVKRRASLLLTVCGFMLLVRLVDVYWVVDPSFYGQHIQIRWTDFVTPVAIGGLWMAVFFWQLRSRPLLGVHDPTSEGAPRETVAF